ncbi:MAG: sulfurtransferase TusA family protein [Nitrososphaerota archaeon]|nr:sulfurtransferase TusA family protein [Nitrososphaerota archaeon]
MSRIIQTDSRDMKMPGPMIALARSYRKAKPGDIIELLASDRDVDLRAHQWCKRTGNKILKVECDEGGVIVVDIKVTHKGKRPSGQVA